MRPLAEAEISALHNVRFFLTDMDETLTYRGRLRARTYDAFERLQRANVTVIPVTAAPSGWCDQMALLDMTYRRLDGVLSDRTVRPLHLEFWGRTWTLTAWCEVRSDFRVFRADRIEAVSPSGGIFRAGAGETYQDYLAQQRAQEGTA